MNAIIHDNMKYKGEVELSLKIGNKVIKKNIHNTGTLQLKRAFAMFLCGGTVATQALRYLPSRIDLRVYQSGSWVTALKRTVPVTSPTYIKETVGEETWSTQYNAVMPYSSLISGIDEQNQYRVYLMCDSIADNDESKDLAYIDVNASDLSTLTAGVSAIISWKLKLLNNIPEEE